MLLQIRSPTVAFVVILDHVHETKTETIDIAKHTNKLGSWTISAQSKKSFGINYAYITVIKAGGGGKIKIKRNVVMQFICFTSRARVSSSCFSSVFAVHQLVLFLYIHKSLFLLSFIPYFCSPFHIYYFIIFEIVRNAFVRR